MAIPFDDFKKVEMKVGEIKSAERIPDTDKLVLLQVDFGEEKQRQIISGIAGFFPNPSELVGKKCAFATNLEPRTIKGLESQGMILTVGGQEGCPLSLLCVSPDISAGSTVK